MIVPIFGIILVAGSWFAISKTIDFVNMTKSDSYKYTIKLNWKQLKDFYNINHDRWSYKQVVAPGYRSLKTKTKAILFQTDDGLVRIHLGPLTWLRFKFSRIFNKFPKGDIGMEIFLDTVQEDIDKIRHISEQEIEEANERMKAVLKGMVTDAGTNTSCTLNL